MFYENATFLWDFSVRFFRENWRITILRTFSDNLLIGSSLGRRINIIRQTDRPKKHENEGMKNTICDVEVSEQQ